MGIGAGISKEDLLKIGSILLLVLISVSVNSIMLSVFLFYS